MIPTLTTEEFDDALCCTPMTLYSSVYAYSALMEKYDETPIDELVRNYYSLVTDGR